MLLLFGPVAFPHIICLNQSGTWKGELSANKLGGNRIALCC